MLPKTKEQSKSLANSADDDADGPSAYKELVESQCKLIRQQQALIDWLAYPPGAPSPASRGLRPLLVASFVLLAVASVSVSALILIRHAETPAPNPNTTRFLRDHPLYDRDNWGAVGAADEAPARRGPSSLVIVSHTATETCDAFAVCCRQLRRLQDAHVDLGWGDIAYNFLVGGDGGVYVGRGWERENPLRAGSVAVAFVGDFNFGKLTRNASDAAAALLESGLEAGRLTRDYRVVAENQTSPKRFYSPGRNVVTEIARWPRYFNGTAL